MFEIRRIAKLPDGWAYITDGDTKMHGFATAIEALKYVEVKKVVKSDKWRFVKSDMEMDFNQESIRNLDSY